MTFYLVVWIEKQSCETLLYPSKFYLAVGDKTKKLSKLTQCYRPLLYWSIVVLIRVSDMKSKTKTKETTPDQSQRQQTIQ